MKIDFVELQNFRKLKSCRIDFSAKETLFVGANNSGKTSAMDALICFLIKDHRKDLSSTDFTLSNWQILNAYSSTWTAREKSAGTDLADWQPLCPALDVWLSVEENELHYVSHLIPTLSWRGGSLGVRLIFQPRDMESLQREYLAAFSASKDTLDSAKNDKRTVNVELWPRSMRDFLERKLHEHFEIKAYVLDPTKVVNLATGTANPQALSMDNIALEGRPFDNLFRIHLIEAQRFLDDSKSAGNLARQNTGSLSALVKKYYLDHLDPSETPDVDDLEALEAIEEARSSFDDKLNQSFKPAIQEIERLGYPGFSDPTIKLTSKLNPLDSLDHDAAVQFDIQKNSKAPDDTVLRLPEMHNGLGYQNLILMIFKLIGFRDSWLHVGKAQKRSVKGGNSIEPLHIVLVEEPEAYLHAQVQQVFIRKAYSVLRNRRELSEKPGLTTQLLVSTHSSYIAHELDFSSLRYFRREPAKLETEVPSATVVNLSDTFGSRKDETARFVERYLKTTHCDLFFANGVILVEGAAERMLIPHFINSSFKSLGKSYISILEIGGRHAYRMRPLIDKLGLSTLVISDIDTVDEKGTKVDPSKGKNQFTGNHTIKTWAPCKDELDDLLTLSPNDKECGCVRVAYQLEIEFEFVGTKTTAIPYTFEDALALTNTELFKKLSDATGLVRKIHLAVSEPNSDRMLQELRNALKSGDKARMALDLLFDVEPDKLKIPTYISEGLGWLEEVLRDSDLDFVAASSESAGTSDV